MATNGSITRLSGIKTAVHSTGAPFLSLVVNSCASPECTCEDHLLRLRAALALIPSDQAERLCAVYALRIQRMDPAEAETVLARCQCVPAEVKLHLEALLQEIEQEHQLQVNATSALEEELAALCCQTDVAVTV